jgi:hypothetical protein
VDGWPVTRLRQNCARTTKNTLHLQIILHLINNKNLNKSPGHHLTIAINAVFVSKWNSLYKLTCQ